MKRFLIPLLVLLLAFPAHSQSRRPSHCIAIANANPGFEYLHKASFGEPLADHTVRLSYIDHSTFLLETQGGLVAATDYTGFLGVRDVVPDVVTMNNAHDSHWTSFPDTRIPHVLEGWGLKGVARDHHLDLGEMLVRNVSTNIRDRFGGGAVVNGNSIFVFEVAGLCIGHLGHLHHEPSPEQYAALGRLDVVMAPVDGGLTLDRATLTRMLRRLRSSVVIPMHGWGSFNLDAFLNDMGADFELDRKGVTSLEVSLNSLPKRPTVVVLEPRFLREPEE